MRSNPPSRLPPTDKIDAIGLNPDTRAIKERLFPDSKELQIIHGLRKRTVKNTCSAAWPLLGPTGQGFGCPGVGGCWRVFYDGSPGPTSADDVAACADSSKNFHQMKLLEGDESWELLKKEVFNSRNYPPILEKIALTCGGNGCPLQLLSLQGFCLK
ncbi:hypothetical protein SASPL_148763 [Salvia splendens]|uniref:Uncharacterized protein n=1 Tax=Salvia splendens TaxID=180675 RepID=A0A8X8Z3P5_SALSN|nr:hypothetical protein SASPL_148763 [Salvia splendens]